MTSFLDVVIYTAIAALAILPAVYVIALNALGPNAAIHRARESAIISDSLRYLTDGWQTSGTDHQAVSDLNARIQDHQRRLKALSRISNNLGVRRALLLPHVSGGVCRNRVICAFRRSAAKLVAFPPPTRSNALLARGLRSVILDFGERSDGGAEFCSISRDYGI